MDINCGTVIDGETDLQQMGQQIFEIILRTAKGEKSKNECAPWPIGVLA